jgi:hypothetical protein
MVSHLLVSPDDAVDDGVADAGRNVKEKSRNDHHSCSDPLGSPEVVTTSPAFPD